MIDAEIGYQGQKVHAEIAVKKVDWLTENSCETSDFDGASLWPRARHNNE